MLRIPCLQHRFNLSGAAGVSAPAEPSAARTSATTASTASAGARRGARQSLSYDSYGNICSRAWPPTSGAASGR